MVVFALMVGIGYGMVFFSTSQIAVGYFKSKRGLVIGIVYSASGFGGACCAMLLRVMANRVGLAWAVRILGLGAGGAMLPLTWWLVPHHAERSKRCVEAFRPSLFLDSRFNLLLIATALGTFPLFVPPFLLPTYATSAGLSPNTGAWLVAGYSLASAVGRVAFGMVADTRVGPVTSLMLALVLASTSILAVWTVSSNLATLALAMVLNGGSSGALLSLQPPVNAAIFGVHQTALTMVSRFEDTRPCPSIDEEQLTACSGDETVDDDVLACFWLALGWTFGRLPPGCIWWAASGHQRLPARPTRDGWHLLHICHERRGTTFPSGRKSQRHLARSHLNPQLFLIVDLPAAVHGGRNEWQGRDNAMLPDCDRIGTRCVSASWTI
jgi:hypothetical protein